MKLRNCSLAKCIVIFIATQAALSSDDLMASEVTIHKNDVSGLLTWTVIDEGISLELIQLLPDFVRAVYGKHSFSKQEIERVASICVFGTIFKNTSDKHLSYRVKSWQYRTVDNKLHNVKTKTQWLEEWRKEGITFSWTMFPDIGEFSVGDWQQGFTTIELPHDSKFDLIYHWKLDGKDYRGEIKNLKCAPATIKIPEN